MVLDFPLGTVYSYHLDRTFNHPVPVYDEEVVFLVLPYYLMNIFQQYNDHPDSIILSSFALLFLKTRVDAGHGPLTSPHWRCPPRFHHKRFLVSSDPESQCVTFLWV